MGGWLVGCDQGCTNCTDLHQLAQTKITFTFVFSLTPFSFQFLLFLSLSPFHFHFSSLSLSLSFVHFHWPLFPSNFSFFLSLSPFHFYFPFILILTLPFFTFSVLIFNFTSQCSLSLSCSYFHFLLFTLSGSTSWQNTSDKKPFCTLVLDRKPSVSKSRKTQICQKKSLRICGEKFYKLSSRLNKCQIAFILTSKYVPTIPENLRIVK